jgi:chemosensory pili system protein ChpA (sensor histidine kinase/response regulator)
MDARDTALNDDLSALAWVHEELRKSLEAANKSLRRFLKESEAISGSDLDAVDPAVLRHARQQLHQGVGALELVGLPAAAQLLRASEAALQRLAQRPKRLNAAAVETLERASFSLLDMLGRRLAGKLVSPLALFPAYRAVQELAGADRVHPADLWSHDWQWRTLEPEAGITPRQPDAAVRPQLESQLLSLMRQVSAPVASRVSELLAGLAAGASQPELATLWQLAAAFYEALAHGLLAPDVYSKRVGSRLLAQLRICEAGGSEVSERLAQDLLFFCAQAGSAGDGPATPRVAAVRRSFGLSQQTAVNYEDDRLGRFDPAWVAQARKRLAGAKDAWSAVAGGELHRMAGLTEQFTLVSDSLRRLYPASDVLGNALQQAVQQTVDRAAPPSAELAMEVATGVLYLDASLEDAEFDHPDEAMRAQRLAQRIERVRDGAASEPLEAWMEELYRRVSDRQTMGSVVQELRMAMSESEKLIDQYFRNPADREVLIPVPGQLAAMRGVLSVLGLDQAVQAVSRMREDVDALAMTEVDPQREVVIATFDRLAGNLGALGFLIDMLSVQPQLAKSLFSFDAASGSLRSVMGGEHLAGGYVPELPPSLDPLIEQARELAFAAVHPEVSSEQVSRDLERMSHEALVADQSGLAETISTAHAALEHAHDDDQRQAVREELAQAMAEFVSTSSDSVTLEPVAAPRPPPAPAAPTQPGQTGLEDDDEMRDIFLEEAREVLQTAHQALEGLEEGAEDLAELTTLRRAFHTLKGSSRMVGLSEFGEAAWACEQLYNARLADAPQADAGLLGFTAEALGYLGSWVDAISAGEQRGHDAQRVRDAAEALQNNGQRLALPLPGAPAVPPLDSVVELPAATELDLSFDDFGVDEPGAVEALPTAQVEEGDLLLDFDGFDFGEPPAADAAVPATPEPDAVEEPPLSPFEQTTVQTAEAPAADDVAEPELPTLEPIALDLALDAEPVEAPIAVPEVDAAEEPVADAEAVDLDQVKQVGALRISIPLFNIYLNEADELSRRLGTELAEWALELHRPVGETAVALAHSLAGSSATVGFADLSRLARLLEHALMRSQALGRGDADEAGLFIAAADEIRRLLHQFAAGFLPTVDEALVERLAAHELAAAQRLQELAVAEPPDSTLDAIGLELPLPEIELVAEVAEPQALAANDALAEAPAQAEQPAIADSPAPTVADLQPLPALPQGERHTVHVRADALEDDDDIDAVDAIDAELFPIFEEEGQDLLPQLASRMREWVQRPTDPAGAAACMRTLHTLKGGARLAGAMRLGEMAHRLETAIEHLLSRDGVITSADLEPLEARVDALVARFEALRSHDAAAYAEAEKAVQLPEPAAAELAPLPPVVLEAEAPAELLADDGDEAPDVAPAVEAQALAPIDWGRFSGQQARPQAPNRGASLSAQAAVRVRTPLLDRLVNHAGEVSITRARIEADVASLKTSLVDLSDNLERLRSQLRDIELQAETQMSSRMEAAKAAAEAFDTLEFDRFTRFQELTRMMAESVNDVGTVQRSLQRTLQSAEDELAAQARLTRDLQDDLLRTRMVEFEGLSERLYRVVRQAAKETGKQVRLDLVGGSIEVDRGVLDRMTAAFEHLLRNCVTHGIERPEQRVAAGKEAAGLITVALTQEGNEVGVEFRDDGAGLNLPRIRERALAMGLLAADAQPSAAELANLIFTPGFSTAETVTELAGRGVGMDVVRADVNAMGGRIETATADGQGTSFKLVLPLTTAVTQVVMLRCGDTTVAVPSTLVETVLRAKPAEVEQGYLNGQYAVGDRSLPFYWLGALLQTSSRGTEAGRTLPVVVMRSAQQRVALHVDEVLGNQEVVVKNLGSQMSRLPGLAGMTLLASGAVALIYNPVALASLYGNLAWVAMREALQQPQDPLLAAAAAAPVAMAPLVLVVDDSLTVRRVTQRLLVREGFRVTLAKDGLEGLARLAEELPAVVLSDIEMPRMDGFDLVRNMRGDARWRDLPVIMITSRIAQKHRDHAAELGVDHYLGKPYAEEDLLALVSRYASALASA